MAEARWNQLDSDAWYSGVRNAVVEAVGGGRISLDDLTAELEDQGWIPGFDGLGPFEQFDLVADLLSAIDTVWVSSDEDVIAIRALVEGRMLAHRLTADELSRSRVAVGPDLDLLILDRTAGAVPTRGGGEWQLVRRDGAMDLDGPPDFWLEGPPGWLAGFGAGDLAVFGREQGVFYLGEAGAMDDAVVQRAVAAMDEAFVHETAPDEGSFALPLVVEAVAADDQLFRSPCLPVAELLDRAGYERDGDLYGSRGGDWERSAERSRRLAGDRAVAHLDLGRCCETALGLVLLGWSGFRGESELELSASGLAGQLAHGDVAEAFVTMAWSMDDEPPPLIEYLDHLATTPGDGGAAAVFARALHAERSGDVLAAEEQAAEAHRRDAAYEPAALLSGWYAFDRGDLARARRLIQEGDGPEEVLDGLDAFLRVPTGVGRNSPCPCGSGRKFKACCLDGPKLSAVQRAVIAHSRMATYALSGSVDDVVKRVFLMALAAGGDPGDLHATGFLTQVGLYEGGVAAGYLTARGPLLDAEDRRIVEALLDAPLQVWEVVTSDGTSVTLAAGDGTEHVVPGVAMQPLDAGQLLLGRMIEVDGEHFLVGTAPLIDLRHKEAVLDLTESEASAEAWAQWYGQAHAELPVDG